MNDRTKKWLTVIGCLVICAVLTTLIMGSFRKTPVQDELLAAADNEAESVTILPSAKEADTDDGDDDSHTVVVVRPDMQPPIESGAVSGGTEQAIQPDVSRPEESEKSTTNHGGGVSHDRPDDTALTDPSTPPPSSSRPQSSGGLPGFDNVPNAGANHEIQANDMYENGNKIGIMG